MMNKENTNKRENRDYFAEVPDMKKRIIETTMKEIMESYDEFINDLLYESQEAY